MMDMQQDDDYSATQPDELALTTDEYANIIYEISEQPTWRHTADKEMDYADGNQLDSELLHRQKALGIPPAVEDLIGPALLSIQGYEATIRSDWRVTPNGDTGGQDIADALNFKLNTAERESKADQACSKVFRAQIGCGIGWVEVAKESDPFKFPYRCTTIHRNEIHWDMKSIEPDLTDARWLRRTRWLLPERIALVFPDQKELIMVCGVSGSTWWSDASVNSDGGISTGLQNAWNEARASTMQEEHWFNRTSKEICLAELWYRRWVNVTVLKTPDGRVVEYDEDNLAHNIAIASGVAKVSQATVSRLRRSYWLGPHCLFDGPTPYDHRYFPYVPFWGFREDNTNIPYGYVRGMKYAQDSLNSGNSKLRWGMSVVRVERTKGAVDMTDEQLRRQVARPDADILLNQEAMARPGARFEVKRDYTLTDQHHQMLQDSRATIQRVGSVSNGFTGQGGSATSGIQEQTQVEQSNQSLTYIMDNFRAGRRLMGEILLDLIINDIGDTQQAVVIAGDALSPERTVIINKPETDEDGYTYLSNDVQRTRLKVALDDVPSTNSYRGQQLNAMSEATKSLPPEYKAVAMPFMVSLMDVPFKKEFIQAIREVKQQQSPEQIQQQIDQAVQQARIKDQTDLKSRELDLKESKINAEIKLIINQAVESGVQAAFSAMQAGAQVAQMPMIAPIADVVMQGAGYQRPNPMGDDPNFPTAQQTAAMNIKDPYVQGQSSAVPPAATSEVVASPPVHQNTHPSFPPNPAHASSAQEGVHTPRVTDNLTAGENV